jgi:hypothetical protein
LRRTHTIRDRTRATYAPAGTHAIGYRAGDNSWWVRWACADCGGVELPLLARPKPSEVRELAHRLAMRRCPECETRRRHAAADARGPAVWYDTSVEDWVVQLPGCRALLPLEIGGFDAAEVLVYRAASDIAHSGDVFDGAPPPA